jgi:UDPglucose 6-dehydrogenase
MRIAVIGVGYVGLVSGACFAQAGYHVTCVDVDRAKIAGLTKGCIPIYEPGLAEVIADARRRRTLFFSSNTRAAASGADIIFIAVGTPPRELDGHADLSDLHAVVATIAPVLRDGCLVVVKSTVPVGSGDHIEETIQRLRPGVKFDVASNPEFLRAGCAVLDFKEPDRVVIGAESKRAMAVLTSVYATLGIERSRVLQTQRRSAELIKYAANGFLATKIAFINEIADLCESLNAHVREVALGIGLDTRIGPQFLSAGPGFGGSCFPKDARALAKTGEECGARMSIIETVLASNDRRGRTIINKIRLASGEDLRGKRVALLGLTFKAGTDDMRDAPSIALAETLIEEGASIHAYDPVGMTRAAPLLPSSVRYHESAFEAAHRADVLVVVTEWDEFRHLDLGRLKREMATPVLVDLRNMFSEEQVTRLGFAYWGIGHRSAWHSPAMISESRRRSALRLPEASRIRCGKRLTATEHRGIAAAECLDQAENLFCDMWLP